MRDREPAATSEELHLVRVELEHLVALRFSEGLTESQRRRYEELAVREVRLLSELVPTLRPSST